MNERGHVASLVPAHPGNRNALKAGVFSPRTLAPLVEAAASEIAARPAAEVLREEALNELASLVALRNMMDRALSTDGVIGRGGAPRNLVVLRLRVSEKLGRALDRYSRAAELDTAAHAPPARGSDGVEAEDVDEGAREPLVETIARYHLRSSMDQIRPADLDVEGLLRAIILTPDPAVTVSDRLRARRLLNRQARRRVAHCTCRATLRARDDLELRAWIDEARDAGVQPDQSDREIAAVVRRHANGPRLEPWAAYRLSEQALADVIATAEAEVEGAPAEPPPETYEDDRAVAAFWNIVLAAQDDVLVKDRLAALAALDDAGALPRCSCTPRKNLHLWEVQRDDWVASVITLISKRHYRAALMIAQFPQTYLAVREAVDDALIMHRSSRASSARG